MKCPVCGGTTSVASTIENSDKYIKRNRVCVSCKRHFYTVENFERFTENKNKKDFDIQACFAEALAIHEQYSEPAPEPKDNKF